MKNSGNIYAWQTLRHTRTEAAEGLMIYGIGADIIEIERVAEIAAKTNFCGRFFSEKENDFFRERNGRSESIAGSFAAKEAFSKALGTGIRSFSLDEISVLRDGLGKPYFEFSGRVAEQMRGKRAYVTISHAQRYAVAYVVIEQD